MKNTAAIQDQLDLLYQLQKEQEFQLKEGISKISNVFTPSHVISGFLGSLLKQPISDQNAQARNFTPLWDKITDQMGVQSPVAKSAIHLMLDQLMERWLAKEGPADHGQDVQKVRQDVQQSALMDHSLNHF